MNTQRQIPVLSHLVAAATFCALANAAALAAPMKIEATIATKADSRLDLRMAANGTCSLRNAKARQREPDRSQVPRCSSGAFMTSTPR